jgi:GT2 family glycosyltransferase
MKPLVYCVASRGWGGPDENGLNWFGWLDCLKSWFDTASETYSLHVCMGLDVVPAMQDCYEDTKEPILGLLHDDIIIYEKDWDKHVLAQFDDPRVGVVGFGGGLGHGHPSLYQGEYHLQKLARQTFLSNMRSWERHGGNFKGERDVAILDGCVLFVRRTLLDDLGGWTNAAPFGYWLYSEWLCCEARRRGLKIRLVGIDFEHLGGKTSGHIARVPSYEDAHRLLWENYRDVLPARVE